MDDVVFLEQLHRASEGGKDLDTSLDIGQVDANLSSTSAKEEELEVSQAEAMMKHLDQHITSHVEMKASN